MPWEIKRFPDGFYVVNKQTGQKKNKKPYQNEKDAKDYLQALYANTGSEALKNN